MKFSKLVALKTEGKKLPLPDKSSSHSFFYQGEQSFIQGPKFLFPWEFLVSVNHFAQYSGPAVVKFLQTSAEQYNLFLLCVCKFSEGTRTLKRHRSVSLTLTFMMFSNICPEDEVNYVNFNLSYRLKTWDRIYSLMVITKIKYSIWDYYNFGKELRTSEFLENPVYPWSVLSLQLHREHLQVSKLIFQPHSASVMSITAEL